MKANENRPLPGAVSDDHRAGALNEHCTTPGIHAEHRDELEDCGISAVFAAENGIYTASQPAELPESVHWLGSVPGALPALVFPMWEADGSETCQVKPRKGSVVDAGGRTLKYVSPKGSQSPQLPVVRAVSDPVKVLIVEGVKQALAVAAVAPADWSIYRICGIQAWMRDGVPTRHLRVVRDRHVVIIPDSDASRKAPVYDGASQLGEACAARRAASVRFARVPGAGSTGIDDVLGREPEAERLETLVDLVETASTRPADQRPANRVTIDPDDDGRPMVVVNADRAAVIDQLEDALRQRDGVDLFRHGGALALIARDEERPVLVPVGEGELVDLVSQQSQTVKLGSTGKPSHAWPDSPTLKALASRHRRFTPIEGISYTPLVRSDGSIVSETGYDNDSRHWIELDPGLEGMCVPDDPTDTELAEAVDQIRDELLGDFVWESEHDRTHAIAAMITPLIRTLCPVSPVFTVDGLQKGVGKGKLVDTISMVTRGRAVDVTPYPASEDELRKQLTAMLHKGDTVVFFDEAHEIDSPILSGFATAANWSDRLLGSTRQLDLVNKTTMFLAGNNQLLRGDIVRRVLRIRLTSAGPRPEDRTGFRHQLPEWACDERRTLLTALLTMVRAWYARGRPKPTVRPMRFGSFEVWQDIIGGILNTAGITGFLEGLSDYRDAVDPTELWWRQHLEWLIDSVDRGKLPPLFLTKQVVGLAAGDADAELPPGIARADLNARELGKVYAQSGVQYHGNYRMVKAATASGGAIRWQVEDLASSGTVLADPSAPADPDPPSAALPPVASVDFPTIEEVAS